MRLRLQALRGHYIKSRFPEPSGAQLNALDNTRSRNATNEICQYIVDLDRDVVLGIARSMERGKLKEYYGSRPEDRYLNSNGKERMNFCLELESSQAIQRLLRPPLHSQKENGIVNDSRWKFESCSLNEMDAL